MTIVEFLTARLDEEEMQARAAVSSQADPENGWGYEIKAYRPGGTLTPHVGIAHEDVQGVHIAYWHPYRVLADVESRRQIVAMHGQAVAIDTVLDHLASVYADHPAHDPAWRLDA